MDPSSIEAGLENLCLGDELTRVMATRLGAIPKISSPAASKVSPPPATTVANPLPSTRLAPPTTPVVLRRQQKKKNRKDRRRNDADGPGKCWGGGGLVVHIVPTGESGPLTKPNHFLEKVEFTVIYW